MLAILKAGRAALALGLVAFVASVSPAAHAQQRPIGVLYAGVPTEPTNTAEAPPPCTEDCFLLSSLTLRGSVSEGMTFELKGGVRARESIKVPLFGPPGQVRVDDVTLDGQAAQVGFDGDKYVVFTSARSFTIRGKVAIGSDELISVPGPLVTVDARLSSGKCIEGERLSGVTGTVLHFDPMKDGAESKPKVTPVFRVARAIRFGREPTFVYRITVQEGNDLGNVRFPLRYEEKVGDVQGSTGWTVEGGNTLVMPTTGHEADLTVSGTLPASIIGNSKIYTTDGRSSYEWWLFEADPEHTVDAAGEAKLVETSRSPINPQFPGARVYLVQKGQTVEVEARSLVRGDVLAAVARTHHRFVAITGRGELINDETIAYDNNGLDHLMISPAGKAMYLSTDQNAQRILHMQAGAKDVLVPARGGSHQLRVQSLSDVSVFPMLGFVSIPSTTYPIATSFAETTIGLPDYVHPIAVLGGDHTRWLFGRGDLIAIVVGIALACFGFQTKRTRVIASVATAGLWFVSREAFVVATSTLFLAGAVFLASRFLRSTWLLIASGALTVAALLGGRAVLASDATVEPQREMFAYSPSLPHPEHGGGSAPTYTGDPKTDITPVSLSFPTSERYVQTSRQLVSKERPFVPRVVYVTSTFVAGLHAVWLALVALLLWAHRDRLAQLKTKIIERLSRRPTTPDPTTTAEAPPF